MVGDLLGSMGIHPGDHLYRALVMIMIPFWLFMIIFTAGFAMLPVVLALLIFLIVWIGSGFKFPN